MSLLFVYSLDYARTRLANDMKGKGGERQFNGLVDVYVKTIKSDGIQGLYRGFVISAVGIFIYRGMYFGLYDSLKPILLGENAGVAASFLLGWAVTITSGLMSYPIDTVRRRMMMTSGGAVKYKNSLDCGAQILSFHRHLLQSVHCPGHFHLLPVRFHLLLVRFHLLPVRYQQIRRNFLLHFRSLVPPAVRLHVGRFRRRRLQV